MLREIIAAFGKESKLDEAFEQVYDSLETARKMYIKSSNMCRRRNEVSGSAVAKKETALNKAERSVRKNVLKHLAISGGDHAVSALVLTSIIIDIERIGDYTKNIVELAEKGPEKLNLGELEEILNRVENAVTDTFERMQVIMEGSDDKDAERLISEYAWVNPLIDGQVNKMLTGDMGAFSPREAVTIVLYLRYLKRIFSHLRNMATSVFRPFHKIGFIPSDIKSDEEEEV